MLSIDLPQHLDAGLACSRHLINTSGCNGKCSNKYPDTQFVPFCIVSIKLKEDDYIHVFDKNVYITLPAKDLIYIFNMVESLHTV